jgi:hypothetical protein
MLARLERRISGRVPYAISTRVAAIVRTIDQTLPRADALGTASAGRYVLTKCATDYLPAALDAYMRLPREYAERGQTASGTSPRALLTEQLEMLEQQIAGIRDAVNRADTEALVVNGRFLESKFGRGALEIDRHAR